MGLKTNATPKKEADAPGALGTNATPKKEADFHADSTPGGHIPASAGARPLPTNQTPKKEEKSPVKLDVSRDVQAAIETNKVMTDDLWLQILPGHLLALLLTQGDAFWRAVFGLIVPWSDAVA
jgi:hypothetical protein